MVTLVEIIRVDAGIRVDSAGKGHGQPTFEDRAVLLVEDEQSAVRFLQLEMAEEANLREEEVRKLASSLFASVVFLSEPLKNRVFEFFV